jgi:aspartate/methionine/tyrosine aminotransferase
MRDARLAGTERVNGDRNGEVHGEVNAEMTGKATEEVMSDLITRLRALPTVAVSDALDRIGVEGALHGLSPLRHRPPSSTELVLLLQGSVAVRAGSEFDPSGHRHLRLSFTADLEPLDEGSTRLTTSLDRLHAERGHRLSP